MIDTPFKALADAYTAMRLERDHLKARAATLEAALRGMTAVYSDEYDHYTGDNKEGDALLAARAALSSAPSAPTDEYRRGVEDAARLAETWTRYKGTVGEVVSSIARGIRALAPSPSSAAPASGGCERCGGGGGVCEVDAAGAPVIKNCPACGGTGRGGK